MLYVDIANTIDGEHATAEDKAKALISCGSDGGAMGVVVNATDKFYSDNQAMGYSNDGILIKLMKA